MIDKKHWQDCAVQMRRLAATEPDEFVREVMQRVALDYDRMAEQGTQDGHSALSVHDAKGTSGLFVRPVFRDGLRDSE